MVVYYGVHELSSLIVDINTCENCYMTARRVVWWPNIEKDIEVYVKSCDNCQSVSAVSNYEYHPSMGMAGKALGQNSY